MSQHEYTGRAPARGPSWIADALVWLLVVGTVGLNIAFAVADSANQADLAVASVCVFFLASVLHAGIHRGVGGLLLVGLVVPVIGWAAESIGTRTGWPFGDYDYHDVLGPMLGDVPVAVPLAWAMMAYPTYVAAYRLADRRWLIAVIGGWSLMAWDLFLDPMMVELHAWSWQPTETTVTKFAGVPLQNFVGWFGVGVVVVAVLSFMPRPRATIAQPAFLYLWVFVSSVVGNALIFDRPEVALVGGIAMGLVALPFAWRLWTNRR